ncbi:MAG: tRNA (guanosine(46)-N7)-methyltransferase TrmB [Metamycoplasmataceae bacterium]
MRLRNNPEANHIISNHPSVITDIPIKIDKNTILEIGMGKGEMLSQMAINNPDKNFIGIEKFPTVVLQALKLIDNNKISNLKVICQDISKLSEAFEGQTSIIWLTFSDPWPKKRHYKRRLTYKTYLEIYKNLLSEKGILKIKTDNDILYDYSIESLKEFGATILFQTSDLYQSDRIKNNIQTGYEIKWHNRGKNINYIEATFTKK